MSRSSDPQSCTGCGHSPAKKMISGGAGFILSGDDWAGKNIRIKNQMAKKNERLEAKRNDHPTVTLAPNVGGERVDSWSEASKLAASQGKDTTGYDMRAKKEG